MDLNKLYSNKRTGSTASQNRSDPRTDFQRDFDRIIFSSAFRRLQNKTQVFPLPGSVFVHNRLTHSLEVASVGRSLGSLVGEYIVNEFNNCLNPDSKEFYKNSLYNVIASACLCHDIGNPAFGHSGEDAIATFFKNNESSIKSKVTLEQWKDLINFEGNANAIRILTYKQPGKLEGGLKLTYTTLASIIKYPCESKGKDQNILHRKKFGFFQSEKKTFKDIVDRTNMKMEFESPIIYYRHPFVWLVEVADDICYNIIDYEDAHRLKIIDHEKCKVDLLYLIECLDDANYLSIINTMGKIEDKNETIAYLRAKTINALIKFALEKYENNFIEILGGKFKKSLFEIMCAECKGLQRIRDFSTEYIYNNRSVVQIENAGYNVMDELLSHLIFPIIKEDSKRSQMDKKAIRLIPPSFLYNDKEVYDRILGVIDFVTGMTDNYAVDLYRRIKGIEIGMNI